MPPVPPPATRTREPSDSEAEPTPDPLEAVRAGAAEVARRSASVRLVDDRLGPYAEELLAEGVLDPAAGGPVVDPWALDGDAGDPEAAVGLVLALDTVNFGSGWHPVVRKRPGMSGAVTMAASLRDWAAGAGPLRAEDLAHLDTDRAHQVFGQPRDGADLDELVGLFTVALNDLGHLVLDHHGGSFSALVAAADGSAASLVELLAELPFFRDVSAYQELDVALYKRAQLAAADLHRAFGGTGPGRFHDLDRLTAFADNLVPHVLRLDGVLAYDEALVERIDAGELLVAGSPEEVEIRALGVHAVEGLRAALAERGHDVPSWHLDHVLWVRGGGPRYKAVPRHRARSVFY